MMLYRPVPFLLLPGLLAFCLGMALAASVYLQGGSRMHSMILGGLLLVIGYQMLLAGLYFGAFGATYGVLDSKIAKRVMSYHSLEKELGFGVLLLALGMILGLKVLLGWSASDFGSLDQVQTAMMSMILSILGIQTIFSGIFTSLLLLNSGHHED